MKIIHKYVLREHAGPLAFSLTALTSLLLLNYIAKRFGDLVGKGLDWRVIAEFFALSVPFTVAMTLPMAVLVSTLYAFNRLASENEITALKASGVSMSRLMIPVLFCAAILSVVMIVFNDQILPRANHRLSALQGDIAQKKPTFALREQVINEVSPGKLFLRANHIDPSSNLMREVTIYDISDALRRRTIFADSGYLAFASNKTDLELTLHSGYWQEVPRNNPLQFQRLFYDVDHIRVIGVANQLQRSDNEFKSDREKSVCELQGEVTRNQQDYDRARVDLRNALVAAAREAVSGLPAVAPPPSLMTEGSPPAGPPTLGRVYCGFVQNTLKIAASAAPRELMAAEVGARTRQARPDTTKARRDSIRAAAIRDSVRKSAVSDSVRAALVADSLRKDSTARANAPKPAIIQQAIQPPVLLPPAPQPVLPPNNSDSIRRAAGLPVVSDSIAAAQAAALAAALSAQASAAAQSAIPFVPQLAPTANLDAVPLVISASIDAAKARMGESERMMNQNAVEIQKKFAISFACIVFVLLGAPIALRFPRGGVGLTIGVSLGVFSLYYVGLIAGESLADRDILSPFVAMWAANAILTVIGLFLLARMGSETATARGGELSEFFDRMRDKLRASRRPERAA